MKDKVLSPANQKPRCKRSNNARPMSSTMQVKRKEKEAERKEKEAERKGKETEKKRKKLGHSASLLA
jgi:hypothetical protein